MAKIKWNGAAILGPVPPVMVSVGDMKTSNIITVAWTGIVNTVPPKTYVSVRPSRHSYNIIKETGELAINLVTKDMVHCADYCGIRSGRDIDKFTRTGLTKEMANEISCPLIKESPLSLECRVCDIIPLGSHDMFICDIVAVDVSDKYISKDGKLHLEKSGLCGFCHGQYYELGKVIGKFGFSHDKKHKNMPPHILVPEKIIKKNIK